jgi:serine/arginine repetitive matrix protein 1
VDMTKVNIEVMKKWEILHPGFRTSLTDLANRWIAGKLSELLGDEDDVIIELCFGLLETSRYVSDRAIIPLRCFMLTACCL